MSDRAPNRLHAQEPIPAPVAEVEAEIKAEIAAEIEAEVHQSHDAGHGDPGYGAGAPSAASPDDGGDWPDPPPPVADPAAEVLAWLRGEFDDLNASLLGVSNRLERQEEAVLRITGSQEAELNLSLAELEGGAAQLRKEAAQLRSEAAVLRDARTQLADSLPGLVAEAVQSAVDGAVDGAVVDLRAAVAHLGAALTEVLPAAVAEAVAPRAAAGAAPGPEAQADPGGAEGEGVDLVSQLHEAQDEAAEWFSIVVDEAVRQAVERWLAPIVSAPTADPASGPGPDTAAEAVPAVAESGIPGDEAAAPADDVAPQIETPSIEAASGEGPMPAESSDGATTVAGEEPPPPRAHPVDPGLPEPGMPRPARRDPEAAATGGGGKPATLPVAVAPVATERTTQSPAEAPAAAEGAAPERESGVTCVLPDVAVGPTLAMGVSAALRRARLRRRQRRRAGAPAAGLFRHDPFAGELSRALERFALARGELAWVSVGASPVVASPSAAGDGSVSAAAATFVVVGERDGREVAFDLAAGPLSLVGPEAHDCGRALVTTFVATHDPSSATAIVSGDLVPSRPDFPGLIRTDDLAATIDRLEAEIVRREGPAAAPIADPPRDDDSAALPTLVVLVVPAVPLEEEGRLVALARRGGSHGVSVVVVGEAVPGATVVTLRPGAVVHTVTPPKAGADVGGSRMFGLGLGPTSELFDLLAAARTDHELVPVGEVADEPFPVLVGSGSAPIKVRVLGPYRIDVDGKEIRSGLRAKARELLAFYLLHPEGTTLDVATEALWPEADPGRGSEWFWTALGNLRSLLRGVTGTKALKIIERDGDRYRIEPVFDVDLWRFQAALPARGAHTGDPEWAAALEAAADLYSGELLAGVDWAWADVPREDLRRRAVDVLVAQAATRLVAGDARGALDALSHAVEVDPVAEQLYRRMMRLHAKQFHRDEVDATFRRLEVRLAELDLQPTPETRELLQDLAE